LQALGIRHVEIAWQAGDAWGQEIAALVAHFPELELGAASVCEPEGVAAAAAAGCRYAVSPVLEASLLRAAAARDLVLVPGVMSASEVHAARRLGCRLVKLFPAVSVGIDHWGACANPWGRRCPSASPPAGWGRRMWPPGWPPGSMRWPWGRRWGTWRRHGRSWRRPCLVRELHHWPALDRQARMAPQPPLRREQGSTGGGHDPATYGSKLAVPSPEPLAIATSLASRLLSPKPFAPPCEASPEAVVERRLLCRPCFG
jgi:hypothetical protein